MSHSDRKARPNMFMFHCQTQLTDAVYLWNILSCVTYFMAKSCLQDSTSLNRPERHVAVLQVDGRTQTDREHYDTIAIPTMYQYNRTQKLTKLCCRPFQDQIHPRHIEQYITYPTITMSTSIITTTSAINYLSFRWSCICW